MGQSASPVMFSIVADKREGWRREGGGRVTNTIPAGKETRNLNHIKKKKTLKRSKKPPSPPNSYPSIQRNLA